MGLFNKKQEKVVIEPTDVPDKKNVNDDNDKQLIVQSLMEDPEVKAYLVVMRGGEKFRIASELQKEN